MPHYRGQNWLAASLTEEFYQHNLGFQQMMTAIGLQFRAHPEFKNADQDQLGGLYQEICNQIWDPDLLGS